MSSASAIRDLGVGDAGALITLYEHLNAGDAPPSPEGVRAVFAHAGLRHFGLFDGEALIASCNLAVIPNLTRGGRSYGVIENVVTHARPPRPGAWPGRHPACHRTGLDGRLLQGRADHQPQGPRRVGLLRALRLRQWRQARLRHPPPRRLNRSLAQKFTALVFMPRATSVALMSWGLLAAGEGPDRGAPAFWALDHVALQRVRVAVHAHQSRLHALEQRLGLGLAARRADQRHDGGGRCLGQARERGSAGSGVLSACLAGCRGLLRGLGCFPG